MLTCLSRAAAFVAVAASVASAQSLATLYARNNGGSFGGAVYFDVTVTNPNGITVTSFDTNTFETVPLSLDVYVVPVTHVGNETNAGAWTRVATGSGVGQGANVPTPVDVADFDLAPGSYGIALVIGPNAGHDYTNGNGSNQTYMNADIRIDCGAASNAPFTGTIFTPRVWNGELYYSARGNGVGRYGRYGEGCMGSNGMVPDLSGDVPRLGQPFTVTVANVPASSPGGFVTLGVSKTTWMGLVLPLDMSFLGATNCSLLADPTVVFGSGNIMGSLSWGLTLPNAPRLLFRKIYNQGIILDQTANGLGLTFSNGGEGIIGT